LMSSPMKIQTSADLAAVNNASKKKGNRRHRSGWYPAFPGCAEPAWAAVAVVSSSTANKDRVVLFLLLLYFCKRRAQRLFDLTNSSGPCLLIFRKFFKYVISPLSPRALSFSQDSKISHCQQPLKFFCFTHCLI
jgi:hypothetical protein